MSHKEKIWGWNLDTKNVLILSFAVFLSATSFYAIVNLHSSVNHEQSLGIVSIFIDCVTFIITGFFTPFFIAKLGVKRLLVLGNVAHILYVGANFYASWWTLIPAAALIGLTAAPYWVCTGVYLTRTAESHSLRTKHKTRDTLNVYNGFFYGIYSLSQIVGNLVSSFILNRQTVRVRDNFHNTSYTFKHWVKNSDLIQNYSNFIQEFIAIYDDQISNLTTKFNDTTANSCGSKDCPSNSRHASHVPSAPEQSMVYTLLAIFMTISISGLLIMIFLDKLQDKKTRNWSCLQPILSCCKLGTCDIKMLLLIPFFSTQFFRRGLLLIDFTKSYASCTWGVGMVGYTMATYGLSSAINSLVFSRVAKYVGRVVLIVMATLLNIAMLVVILWWQPVRGELWVLFVVAAVWGIGEGILLTQCNVLIARIFSNNTDSAFAVYWTWKATGFAMSIVFSYFLCLFYKLYFLILYEFIAVVLYVGVEVIFSRQTVALDIEVTEDHPGEIETLT